MRFLGIDTSNYTTSAAVLENGVITRQRIMLDSQGALGLRQSEAHFLHTKNLPLLFKDNSLNGPYAAVGCSDRPRNAEGSYMPCFLAGVSAASASAAASDAPLFRFSHQEGHIAAALFGAGVSELFGEGAHFFAFHLSGGTTELLDVSSSGSGFDVIPAAAKSDISAGQAIDRVGRLLGLSFPSGAALDTLALEGKDSSHLDCFKNGAFCFSGLENRAADMVSSGASGCDVARFTMLSIAFAVKKAAGKLANGALVMSGGVASSRLLRDVMDGTGAIFAPPAFCGDNADGIAVLASLALKRM